MRSGRLAIGDGGTMAYISVRGPSVPLVLIPGAGDGLQQVGKLSIAWTHGARLGRYRLLAISRRHPLPRGHSIAAHADDYVRAIRALVGGPVILECTSAGGPIGQWIAAHYPEIVRGLILSCTLHRTPQHTRAIFERWIGLARARRWAELTWTITALTLRPRALARARPLRGLLRLLPPPRDPDRFENLIAPCLDLNTGAIVRRISCPTLVIGGRDDRVLGDAVQRELASLIPGSRLLLYDGYGHGNSIENPDYTVQVGRFARSLR